MNYKFDNPITGTIEDRNYQCTIEWQNGKLISDEPLELGGENKGPDPYTLFLSSLASCTLITLRMYIDRKGWVIPTIAVRTNMYQETKHDKIINIIDCDIILPTEVEDEKKLRLQEIAERCPISKLLEGEIKIRTFMARDTETREINYANDEITVIWKPAFCQHSTRCFTQLPNVFDPKLKKWIDPTRASTDEIIQQVRKCPSGALTFVYNKKKE